MPPRLHPPEPGLVLNHSTEHHPRGEGEVQPWLTINGATKTTVDYEYDTEGNRFIKRTDMGGVVTEIHDLSSDYRVHADGSSEVHTIEIRNGNEPVARFRFQDNLHNSGVWAPSSLFSHRLGADLLRIASLEGGISKLPSLLGFAFTDAYYAVKLLPQIQNRERLLVLLYWTLAAIVALAALTLLVRNWRRNPDDGPGLLPVAVYRFGSILALLSFSATGCIQKPSTEDGSQYLLFANGSTGSSSEGGSGSNSSTMSVLGAFYFISTHNGSTDIVTNSDGVAVARFVYEPFGKVNSDLTDLDPDRNGIHYGETFMFTGQEFEPETGLYNYKARIYDPETTRFLQPDPKHTERAGFDNWDRYQYANNNPVNFTDPTGESWLSKQTRLHVNMGRFWDTTFGRKGISGWFGARLSVNGWLKPLIKKQILKERNTAATQKFLVTYLVGISQGDDPQEVLKKAVEGFITTYIQMTVMAEFASKYFGDKYGSQINKVFTDSLGLGMVLGLAFGPVLGVAAGTSYGVYGLYKVFKNARREMSDIERAQRCGEASSSQPGAFPNGANVYVACR